MKNTFLSALLLICLAPFSVAQFQYRNDNLGDPPKSFKPYVVELCTPSGVNVLRDAPGDHLHHHGLMLAYKMNGVNFWEENDPNVCGREVQAYHKEVDALDKKSRKVLISFLEWKSPKGDVELLEARTIEGSSGIDKKVTKLSWTSVFTVPPGKDKVEIVGSDYNGLGMRFIESMDKDGKFFADAGAEPKEGRLTQCRWMAYTTKNPSVTVALCDRPENPRPMRVFTMGGDGKEFAYISASLNQHKEPLIVEKDKPITIRYTILLWDGEKAVDEIEGAANNYVKEQ